MRCPECGAEMVLRMSKRFSHKNGEARRFYGCTRWPECNGTHGAHPDGRPLGIPADAETKRMRQLAHSALDNAYKDTPRPRRYKKLQELMGLSEEDAHIAKFDIGQCKKLIAILNNSEVT